MPKALDNQFYRLIADESIVAILVLDDTGGGVYMNSAAKDLLEFPLEENISFQIDQIFPEPITDNRLRVLDQNILKMQGLMQDILVKKLNSQKFVANLGIKKIQIDNKSFCLLMLQDVTLQKKMQREITEKQTAINQAYQDLLNQNKQLIELDQAKTRFIAVTTHELRTPLSAMMSSAEILKMKIYDSQADHDQFVDMIYDQGVHLLNLVNDILDFAKIRSGKMDYYIEEKNVCEVLDHEVQNLLLMAENSEINLKLETPENQALCFFDEVRLKQVLTNLINNAIKYNKKGGQVFVTVTEDDEFQYVHIRDTGRGISEDDKIKVFNEFETLGKISNHAKGTGLGLSISQKMMQSMGGDILLESELGVGSTFTVTIPKQKILPDENYRARPDYAGGTIAA